MDRIYHLAHGFIERIGRGPLKTHNLDMIARGQAVRVSDAMRRLWAALQSDEGLLAACITEARRRGHPIE